ncbi:MAG: type II toxin-antitoxin system VapC family toxin [Terracidiphilus sp.]|jgi:predicted nucleic acid-binding protein
MAFVLDASISAVWALADESSPLAEIAANRLKNEIALVPPLWWYEVRNLLVINERRQRMTVGESALFLELLSSFPIQVDPVEDEQTIFRCSRQYRLSFYDAAYLSVALRNRLPIATLDKDLRDAALAAGVSLLA